MNTTVKVPDEELGPVVLIEPVEHFLSVFPREVFLFDGTDSHGRELRHRKNEADIRRPVTGIVKAVENGRGLRINHMSAFVDLVHGRIERRHDGHGSGYRPGLCQRHGRCQRWACRPADGRATARRIATALDPKGESQAFACVLSVGVVPFVLDWQDSIVNVDACFPLSAVSCLSLQKLIHRCEISLGAQPGKGLPCFLQ